MKKWSFLASCVLVLALLSTSFVGVASSDEGSPPVSRLLSEKGQPGPPTREPAQKVLDLELRELPEDAEDPKPEPSGDTFAPEAPEAWTNIMTEGFEGSFPGSTWTLGWNANSSQAGYGYTWDDDDHRAQSGYWSGWCADGSYEGNPDLSGPGPYPNDLNAWMIYGPFDLSDACDAELLFYHWTKTELSYDELFVGASLDGSSFSGTTWSGDWASSCSSTGGWCYVNFDLTDVYSLGDLTGQSQVWIAFVFQSDGSVTDEGTYLDDIVLRKETDCGDPDLEATAISWIPTDPDDCPGTSIVAHFSVCNRGGAPAQSFTNKGYIQGQEFCSWPVSSLAPGSCVSRDCSLGNLASGSYILSLEADTYNDVTESNEGNNNLNEVMDVVVCPNMDPDIEVSPASISHICPQQTALSWDLGAFRARHPHPGSFLSMKNPSAVYCNYLGYDYHTIQSLTGGQHGICTLPDDSVCDAWDFLNGKCGQDYSICADRGLQTVTLTDGNNPWSPEYAVCADAEGNLVESVTDMMMGFTEGGMDEESRRAPVQGPPDPAPRAGIPPSSFDWRSHSGSDWMTSVKNQGICGSCWAFSAIGASEAVANIAAGNPSLDLNLSEQYLVTDCALSAGACDGGWQDAGLQYIRDSGIPDEGCLPYQDGGSNGCTYNQSGCDSSLCTYSSGGECSDYRCSDRCADWASRLHTIDGYSYVGSNPSRDTVKQALVDHGPLSIAMNMSGSFNGNDIYTCTSTSLTHAVVIAGYDDAGGYWIVKNSWGSTWGPHNDGYFRVAYGSCGIESDAYYVEASPASGLTISNAGGGNLEVQSVSEVTGSCWLTLSPRDTLPVTLGPGQSTVVDVAFDCDCVGEGIHYDTIRIRSNDPDEDPKDVPVSMEKPPVDQPDLIVSPPQPSVPPPYVVGQDVDWSVRTTNQGNGSAQGTHVGYYLGTSCSDTSYRFDSDIVDPLGPGAYEDDHDAYIFEPGDVGTRYVIAMADYQDEEPNESNENNNTNCYGPFVVDPEPDPCYNLTLTHQGAGGDPTASPPNSTGCPLGQYHAGESITLTPYPDPGCSVIAWTGTDSPSSNHLTMPANDHTVTVSYGNCQCDATVRIGSGTVAPGGTVDIPVDALGVPSPGVGAATLEVHYDNTVVEATACVADPGNLFDTALCNIDHGAGTVSLTLVSTAGVAGDPRLADITFRGLGADGECSLLDGEVSVFAYPSGASIPTCVEDGQLCIVACVLGDVNCDDQVNSIDALFILQKEVGLRPNCTDSCPLPSDQYLNCSCGDVNNDGACNSIDALFILQCEVGIPNILCPASAAALATKSQEVPEGIEKPESPGLPQRARLRTKPAAAKQGDNVTVPIITILENQEVGAATVEMVYDPEVLAFAGCTADPEGAFDSTACNADEGSGKIRVSAISTGGASGQLVLAEIAFQIVGKAGDRSVMRMTADTFADPGGRPIEVKTRNSTVRISGK